MNVETWHALVLVTGLQADIVDKNHQNTRFPVRELLFANGVIHDRDEKHVQLRIWLMSPSCSSFKVCVGFCVVVGCFFAVGWVWCCHLEDSINSEN